METSPRPIRDKGRDTDIRIPLPTHKFTTTNPSTNSPTYHLVYDLTSHKSSVDSSPFIPIDINKNTSSSFSQVNRNIYHPSYFPETGSKESTGVSNIRAWDGSMASVPVSVLNANNRGHQTHLVNREVNIAINYDQTASSFAVNGDTDSHLTIHFSEPSRAQKTDRPPGVGGNNSNDANKIISDFIEIKGTTTSNIDHGDVVRQTGAAICSLSENYTVNTPSPDATSISSSIELGPCHSSSPRQNVTKIHLPGRVTSRFDLSKRPVSTNIKCGPDSKRPSRVFNYKDDKNRLSSCDRNDTGLTRRNGVSQWTKVNNCDRDFSLDNPIQAKPTINIEQSDKIRQCLNVSRCEDILGISHGKRGIFKREGECLRLFIVGAGNKNSYSNELSDNEHIQNTADTSVTKPPSYPSLLKGSISSHLTSRDLSKTKKRADDSEKTSKPHERSRTVDKSTLKTPKAYGHVNIRKPVNRWDSIELRTAQIHASVSREEATAVTREKHNITAAGLDIKKPINRDLPLRHKHTLENNNTFTGVDEYPEHVKTNILNTDIPGQELITSRSKLSLLQYVNSSANIQSLDLCKTPLQSEDPLPAKVVPKEIIDRNKYIINAWEVPRRASNSGQCSADLNAYQIAGVDNTSNSARSYHVESLSGVIRQSTTPRIEVQDKQCLTGIRETGDSYCQQVPSATSSITPPSVKPKKTDDQENYLYKLNKQYGGGDKNQLGPFNIDIQPQVNDQFSEQGRHLFKDKLSLCDKSSNTEHISPRTHTARSDFQTEQQKSTSSQSVDINHQNCVINNSEEVCGEETLKYRKQLRDQCKRHHLLKVYGVSEEDASIKKDTFLNGANDLGFSKLVSPQQGTYSGEFRHSGNSHKNKQPLTQRQKFEIRHNKVSDKIATFLQLNNKETGNILKTQVQDKDLLKNDLSNNCVPRLEFSLHKDSPRARFERDRAARAYAVISNCSSVGDSERQLADKYYSDIKSLSLNGPNVKCLTSTAKLGSSAELEFKDFHSHHDTEKDNLFLSQATSKGQWSIANSVSQLCFSTPFTDIQHSLAYGVSSSFGLLDSHKTGSCIRSLEWGKQATLENDSLRCPTAVNFNQPTANIDTAQTFFPGKLNGSWYDNIDRNSSVFVSERIDKGNNSFIKAEETSIIHGTDLSTDHREKRVSHVPWGYCVQGNYKSNYYSDRALELNQQSLPQEPVQSTQQGPAVKAISSDSVSSSGYGSENSSALKKIPGCENNSTSNCYFGIHNSPVHLIPLQIHTSDLKCSDNSQKRFAVGNNEYENINTVHYGNIRQDLKDSSLNNKSISFTHQSSSPHPEYTHELQDIVNSDDNNNIWKLSHDVNYSVDNVIHGLNPQSCDVRKCICVFKQKPCSNCKNQFYTSSNNQEVNLICESAPLDKTSCVVSADNSGRLITDITRIYENVLTYTHLKNNGRENYSNNSVKSCGQVESSVEEKMLASKGVRIYESREHGSLMSPFHSSYAWSTSSPSFQWGDTRYLILPTVVESLPAGTTAKSNSINAPSNSELLAQRSISDSGIPARPHASFIYDVTDNDFFNNRNREDKEISKEDLARYPRSKRLSFRHRSMSVDVLCADGNRNSEFNSANTVPIINNVEENGNDGRGYVEWKTCSAWLRKTNTDFIDGRDSRGYVEWDTIWTTAAPWLAEQSEDEHVYEDIGEDDLSISYDDLVLTSSVDKESNTPAIIETPPALPERTYISRLTNINCKSANNITNLSPPSSSSSHRHRSNHHSHSHHHDNSNCRKHHHHHHHHHHSHNNHKEHRSPTSSTTPDKNSAKLSSSSSSSQHEHTTGSSTKPSLHKPTKLQQAVSDESQNYAKVNKLKGYKFSNMKTVTEPPNPHHSKQSAIYSENYWHLTSVTSQDRAMTWQSGDVLDYIDGLHDSMSPKRRDNIYILLNNKQTRAKFSESLEIESRLLSRGLISGSSVNQTVTDKMDVQEAVGAKTGKDVVSAGLVRRKGAIAPVSSTYV